MTKQQHIEYWVSTAEHDLKTAESMFQTAHYDWCLYIGHLVLEKILKALYVLNNEEFPPKIHDLIILSKRIPIELNEDQYLILERTNNYNIEARYPDEKQNFYKLCTKDYTTTHFQNIKEMYSWLKSLIK